MDLDLLIDAHIYIGYDELKPVSKQPEKNWFGLGLTAIDALDTSILMNLTHITQDIKTFIQKDLKYTHDGLSNVFEVTIRILGGFLSAHHLTSDPFYLHKAQELGSILLLAFQNSPAGIPASSINFSKMEAVPEYLASTAEATTLQLEFKYLSFLTQNATYWNAAQNVFQVLL